jgi:hypothetical protein
LLAFQLVFPEYWNMTTSLTELLSILRAGSSLTIAAPASTPECVLLAKAAQQAGTQLTLRVAAATTLDFQRIAAEGPHHVCFFFE